jgi:hypothetical protein
LACSNDDTSWEWALRPGTYDVTPFTCASTNAKPLYPTPEHQATLFDFDELTRHQLIVMRGAVDEVLADADCTLTVSRRTFTNSDGIFSLRGDRRHVFTPDGCTFSMTFQGQALPIGAAYGSLFADRPDTRSEEIPYEIASDGDGFSMTSRDLSNLNDLWQNFGCSRPDRLKWAARPVSI